jgi:membrane protein required for beta-lactamase induction
MRSVRAFESGVGAMLIWIIVGGIPMALLGSAVLASKGGASRRYPTPGVWSETPVEHKVRHDQIPTSVS